MTEAVANENSCLSGRLATRRAAGWLAALGRWRGTDDAPRPFHGYYFRPFTAQGAPCARGAYDCIVKGHQIGGFALLAWPARWGVSGIMTFIVNHDGVVHSRNFGAQTGSANLDCKPRIGPPAWTALKESLAGAAAHVAPGGQLRDDLQWRHRQVHRAVARGHRPA